MNSKVWGIIGLGWLGQALAKSLANHNHQIWGTHRDTFDFQTDPFPTNSSDILFLNTPPVLALSAADYADKIKIATATKLIFISSTSVLGKNSGVITEKTVPEPLTESAQWLWQVEQKLQERFQNNLLIIRPGGLIGDQRHPIYSLAKKGELAKSNHSVNLIHRADLIALIEKAVESKISLLHAVAPEHPRRDQFYQSWAQKLNLQPLNGHETSEPDRIIDSEYATQIYTDWICPKLDFL